MDSKITKSQRWLMDALIELMQTEPYQKIKVKEIADKADLNPRTFYRYFRSKDDVLRLYSSILLQSLSDKILNKLKPSFQTIVVAYFEFWNDHMNFLELLKQNHMIYFFEDNLDDFMTEVALTVKPWLKGKDIDKKTLYQFYFNIGGFWYLTTKWIAENPRSSPEEMSCIIVDLFTDR